MEIFVFFSIILIVSLVCIILDALINNKYENKK